MAEIDKVVEKAARSLGYDKLKAMQMSVISHFISGNDVFVSLPTGFGKSLCYGILSLVFDELHGTVSESMTVVISPLMAIMRIS